MTVHESQEHPRIGLALGSGGIKGLAHIGVLKVLRENHIPVHCIAGSSIGAWVGSHYALFEDIERLEQLTVEHREDKLKAMFELTLKGGLIKGNKLTTLLKDWLQEKSFADTRLPFAAVTTDIISGEEVVITKGPLTPAVQASMAIPSLFKPVFYQDRYLLDGGLVNPVPVDVVRRLGADIVIAVNLDNYLRPAIFLSEEVESVSRVSGRALDLLSHQLALHCVEHADVVIEPNNAYEGLASWSGYFWRDVGPEHVGRGADATRDVLPQIQNLLDNYDA